MSLFTQQQKKHNENTVIHDLEEGLDKLAMQSRQNRIMEELSSLCGDRENVLTTESLVYLSSCNRADPVKLEIDCTAGPSSTPASTSVASSLAHQKKSSKSSSINDDKTSKYAIRRQRVEELTRFFMEGKSDIDVASITSASGLSTSVGSGFSGSAEDEKNQTSPMKEAIDQQDGYHNESTDSKKGADDEPDDLNDNTDPVSQTSTVHFNLLQEKIDQRIFNPLLLSIREKDPLLYGSILCHPLVAGYDAKKDRKKKKKRKDRERRGSASSSAAPVSIGNTVGGGTGGGSSSMLTPDFNADPLSVEDTILNASRFVARAIAEESIQSLLLAVKLVLSCISQLQSEDYLGCGAMTQILYPLASHLRVLSGGEPPKIVAKRVLPENKKLSVKEPKSSSSSNCSVTSTGGATAGSSCSVSSVTTHALGTGSVNEFNIPTVMDLDTSIDPMAALRERLNRFDEASADDFANESEPFADGELDEEALMAQAIALSLSSEISSAHEDGVGIDEKSSNTDNTIGVESQHQQHGGEGSTGNKRKTEDGQSVASKQQIAIPPPPTSPRAKAFTAKEMISFAPFRISKQHSCSSADEKQNTDSYQTLMGLISRVFHICSEYLESCRLQNTIAKQSLIQPHPLTFLLVHSLMDELRCFEIMGLGSEKQKATWELLKCCTLLTLFRVLEVNFFHVDVLGLAPASVGLGQVSSSYSSSMLLGNAGLHNPLTQRLRKMVIIYVEDEEEFVVDKERDIVAPLLNPQDNLISSTEIVDVVKLYKNCVHEQALACWTRGVPYFYPSHGERHSLLVKLLSQCTTTHRASKIKENNVQFRKFRQLDALCGRLALPDLVSGFVPATTSLSNAKTTMKSNAMTRNNEKGDDDGDNAEEESLEEAPTTKQIAVDDTALLASIDEKRLKWCPEEISHAIHREDLSAAALQQFLVEMSPAEILESFGLTTSSSISHPAPSSATTVLATSCSIKEDESNIPSASNCNDLMEAYKELWRHEYLLETQVKEAIKELPSLCDSLRNSVSDNSWPTLARATSSGKDELFFAPVLPILEKQRCLNRVSSIANEEFELNERVLLLRSIQDLMLERVGGINGDQPSPLEFDGAHCAETITLSDGNRTAKQHTAKQWGMVMITKGCAPGTGIHEWAVRLDKCEKGHIFLGVCTRDASVATYVGGDRQGWGLIGTRALWHNRSKIRGDYGDGFSTGSTVRVRLNTDSGALSFGVDDTDWGIAFDGLTQCGTLFPAIGLYQREDQVTILPVSTSICNTTNITTSTKQLTSAPSIVSATAKHKHIQSNLISPFLSPLLHYLGSLVESCCALLHRDDVMENVASIELASNPLIASLLSPLLSSLCLMKNKKETAGIMAIQFLPWFLRIIRALDCFNRQLHDDENGGGLDLDIAGEWELKSMAAGNIPAQQYHLHLVQEPNGQMSGHSTGSFSAVTLTGAVRGSKVRFLEKWRQGGTCLVEGRLRADGRAFTGTYEDTKSKTCGSILGSKLDETSQSSARTLQSQQKVSKNKMLVLEMTAALLIGQLCNTLIVVNMQDCLLHGGHSPNASVYKNEADQEEDVDGKEKCEEWLNHELLLGGLPIVEVQDHLHVITQRIFDFAKRSYIGNQQLSSIHREWLNAAMPPSFSRKELTAQDIESKTNHFISDLIAGRGQANDFDKWVVSHVGESPLLKIGGEVMKTARRTVIGAMIWHTGCAPSLILDDGNIEITKRPSERLIILWRSAQRLIEWAIRAKNSMGCSYSDVASLVNRKARFLLEIKPSPTAQDTLEVVDDDIVERFHSQILMQVASFIQTANSLPLKQLREGMLVNCTRSFFRYIGLISIRQLLGGVGVATASDKDQEQGLHLSCAIASLAQWVSPSLWGKEMDLMGLFSSSTNNNHSSLSSRSSSIGYGDSSFSNLHTANSSNTKIKSTMRRIINIDKPILSSQQQQDSTNKQQLSSYVGGIGGCGQHLIDDLRGAFEVLYSLLASLLSRATWANDMDLQLVILQSWGITIQPDDHAFLSRVGIFRIVQRVLDEARCANAHASNRMLVEEDEKEKKQIVVEDCGLFADSKRRVVQAALKVVHLLAAQIASTGETTSSSIALNPGGMGRVPLGRKPSGPETLGKSVFNMLYTELRNAIEELRLCMIKEKKKESFSAQPKVEKSTSKPEQEDPSSPDIPPQHQLKRKNKDGIQESSSSSFASEVTNSIQEAHQYCYQICCLLYSVSGASICRSFLSSSRWLYIFLALIDCGTPQIQRRVLKLLQRLLPTIDPCCIHVKLDYTSSTSFWNYFDMEVGDDDDETLERSVLDSKSNLACGVSLVNFLIDIVGTIVPSSVGAAIARRNLQEKHDIMMIEQDAIHSKCTQEKSNGINSTTQGLAGDVVILLRSLFTASKWVEPLNTAISEALAGIPSTSTTDVIMCAEEEEKLLDNQHSCSRRALSALCILGGHIDGLHVGGSVKILPKSNISSGASSSTSSSSASQEIAFRGARGTLVSYDSQKGAAEVMIRGMRLFTDRLKEPPTQFSATTAGTDSKGSAINSGSLNTTMRPIRVPIDDLSAIPEVEINRDRVSEEVINALLVTKIGFFLQELESSVIENAELDLKRRVTGSYQNEMLEEDDEGDYEEENDEDGNDEEDEGENEEERHEDEIEDCISSTTYTTESTSASCSKVDITPEDESKEMLKREAEKEKKMNRMVLCLHGFRSISHILKESKYALKLISSCDTSEKNGWLKQLFRVAVHQTNTTGLVDICSLEESWLFLWSRWCEIQENKIKNLSHSDEDNDDGDENDEEGSLKTKTDSEVDRNPSVACLQMMEMGFPREWCEVALSRCSYNVEAAINFCFEHSGDMDRLLAQYQSNDSTRKKSTSSSSAEVSSSKRDSRKKTDKKSKGRKSFFEGFKKPRNPLLEQLSEMGFPVKWCKKALEANRNNVDAALTWILSNGETLEMEDRQEEEEAQLLAKQKEDNSDGKSLEKKKRAGPNPLCIVSGQASIGADDLIVEGLAGGGFASIGARDCMVTSGRWFYEATLYSSGCIQIGWADAAFSGASDRGDGVGDGANSWAYDGWRQQKWHGASSPWGWKWKMGDVIGCGVDADAGILFFSLNGKMKTKNMGVAFRGIQFAGGIYPCASFNRRERLQFNLGGLPFKYPPPPGFQPILNALWNVGDPLPPPCNNTFGDKQKKKGDQEIEREFTLHEYSQLLPQCLRLENNGEHNLKKELYKQWNQDCLEEHVGDENYFAENRYFHKENHSSLLRSSATALHQHLTRSIGISGASLLCGGLPSGVSGGSSGGSRAVTSRVDIISNLKMIPDEDIFMELSCATRCLAVLHARRALLTLLAKWPKAPSFSLRHLASLSGRPEAKLDCQMEDEENLSVDKGMKRKDLLCGTDLFVNFLKLVSSLSGQSGSIASVSSKGNATIVVEQEEVSTSPFVEEEIYQLLDNDVSGRHALFLLEPIVKSAISEALTLFDGIKWPGLIHSIFGCIYCEVEKASGREYARVVWDGSEHVVVGSLLRVSNEPSGQWTDRDAIHHPNLTLAEWFTRLLLTLADEVDTNNCLSRIRLVLFQIWMMTLRSPSMCLKEKGANILSGLLQDLLSQSSEPFLSNPLIHSQKVPSLQEGSESKDMVVSLMSKLPVERIFELCQARLHKESRQKPIYSKYLQAMVELASSLHLAHQFVGLPLCNTESLKLQMQIESAKEFAQIMESVDLNEIKQAKEQIALEKAKEKEQALELEKKAAASLEMKSNEENASTAASPAKDKEKMIDANESSKTIEMVVKVASSSEERQSQNDDNSQAKELLSGSVCDDKMDVEEDISKKKKSSEEEEEDEDEDEEEEEEDEEDEEDDEDFSDDGEGKDMSSSFPVVGSKISIKDVMSQLSSGASPGSYTSMSIIRESPGDLLRRSTKDSSSSKKSEVGIWAKWQNVYPEETFDFDTSQLTPHEIQQLEFGKFGLLRKQHNDLNNCNNVLSDFNDGGGFRCFYSGTLTQHRLRSSQEKADLTKQKNRKIPELGIGGRVMRGPNWKWRDQDGGEGSVGRVESITAWSGVEGEGRSVRWPNDSLYTYRWGADGNYDLVHVEVDETDKKEGKQENEDEIEVENEGKDAGKGKPKILKKYPFPIVKRTTVEEGKFGSEFEIGILFRLYEAHRSTDFEMKKKRGVIELEGVVEWPDYGACATIVGEYEEETGKIWFQELQLFRGDTDMGWTLRYGSESWQPGTKYTLYTRELPAHHQSQSAKNGNNTMDNMMSDELEDLKDGEAWGEFRHFVVGPQGKIVQLSGELSLSSAELFRMSTHHHSPSLEISSDGLTVSCRGGESRNLSLATVGFYTGVHYWEVKINHADFGSVYIGVCAKAGVPGSAAALSNRLNRWLGWGFVNFRATYHNSTERIYGDHFNNGDTIGVQLDMNEGKLAFFLDGIKYGEHNVSDLGVAFDNLHGDRNTTQSATSNYTSNKTLYPCIGMRKAGDSVTINGKWVSTSSHQVTPYQSQLTEAVEVGTLLCNWSCSAALNESNKMVENFLHQSWIEWKKWAAERWHRYPIRPRGVYVDIDTNPLSCVAASEKAGLTAPYLAGDRVRICSSGGRELDNPEEAVILGVYRGSLWYRTETQGNEGADEGRSWAWYWTPSELMELILIRRQGKDMTAIESSALEGVDTLIRECQQQFWRQALHHSEVLALESYQDFVQLATSVKQNDRTFWTTEMDMQVVEGINALCAAVGLDAVNLHFSDVTSALEHSEKKMEEGISMGQEAMNIVSSSSGSGSSGVSFGRTRTVSVVNHNYFAGGLLKNVSGSELRARCAILRVLNFKLDNTLPLVRLDNAAVQCGSSNKSTGSILLISTSRRICALRRLIFTSTKRNLWDAIIRASTTSTPLPSDEYEDPREIRVIRINRIQAQSTKLTLLPQPSDRLRKSVFGQLYREMRTWSDASFRRAYCGKGHGGQRRAFKVKFLGEGVNDYGGPYRAVFEQVVDELQMDSVELTKGEQGLLPLLVPCPNRRSGTGQNQDKFLLNPSCGTSCAANGPVALELHRFLGKLIGTAVRHGLQMGLDLPSLVWRPLANLPVSCLDLESVDQVAVNMLKTIAKIKCNDSNSIQHPLEHLNFTTHLSDGTEVVLRPNGDKEQVTPECKDEYLNLVKRKRLLESAEQLQALKDGLSSVLPMELSPLFTANELEVLICGRREVDVELLRQCTEYDEVDESTPHVKFFWQVLTEMSNKERTAFLRFVWARSRMPNSAKDFPMNFKIQAAHDQGARNEPDKYLPHAQTCFFSLSLPAYSSIEILRSKLLFAIQNSPNMDADVRLHNAEGWADA